MRKDDWAKVKRAYEITVNGCGNDCLACERNVCLCDTRQIRKDARRYIKQKTAERKSYKIHKTERRAKANLHYEQFYKVANPMECRKIKNDLLHLLPDDFGYELAGKLWLVEYSCARERIRIFMERGFVDKRRDGLKVICFKTETYYKTFASEANGGKTNDKDKKND